MLPLPRHTQACRYFVQALPLMLPCSVCGHDFLEFLRKGNEVYPPRSVDEICSSRESLFGFTVAAHNNVSKNTNPLREPVSIEDAAKMWGAIHSQALSKASARWVGSQQQPLCREVGETDCVEPVRILLGHD